MFDPIAQRQIMDIAGMVSVLLQKVESLVHALAVERGDTAECLSLTQAANTLGVCEETISALVRAGEVRTITLGRRRVVPRQALRDWITRRLAEPQKGAR